MWKHHSHFSQFFMYFSQEFSVELMLQTFWSFCSYKSDGVIYRFSSVGKHKIACNDKSSSSLSSMTVNEDFFTSSDMHIHHSTIDKKIFDARVSHVLPVEKVDWNTLRLKGVWIIGKSYLHVLNSISAFLMLSWLLKIKDCF